MNPRALFASALLVLLVGCQKPPVAEVELKASRLVDMAKPATVMVISDYTAKIGVPAIDIPQDRIALLRERMIAKVDSGEVPREEKAVQEAAVQEILNHWPEYLVATGETREIDATMSAVGSGFIVTPDGTIVTNAHVVATDGDELKQGLVENALQKLIDQDVADLKSALGDTSDETIELLKKVCVDFYVQNMTLGDVQLDCHAMVANGTAGANGVPEPLSAKVLREATGTPIPGKDVAILKVEGVNMPTLDLGDDSALNVGDKLFPLGFPADATFFPEFDKSSVTEPSLTAGLVSARKKMADGWEVIQTDAAIRGGNSGGPVLSTKGQVIGLATFQLIDQKTGVSATGANFVVPATVVREFLSKANVQPKASELTKGFFGALRSMDEAHFSAALSELKELDKINPGEPFLKKAIQECEAAIKAGKDRSPGMSPALIGGGVAVLLGVAVILFLASKAFKSRRPGPFAEQPGPAQVASAAPPAPAAPSAPTAPPAPEAQPATPSPIASPPPIQALPAQDAAPKYDLPDNEEPPEAT